MCKEGKKQIVKINQMALQESKKKDGMLYSGLLIPILAFLQVLVLIQNALIPVNDTNTDNNIRVLVLILHWMC